MRDTEREAKKYIGPDGGSWSGRARARKAFRQMTLTPDEESPRHKRSRKGRKKHVHKWGPSTIKTSDWPWRLGSLTLTEKFRTCKKCGYKDTDRRID